ASYKFDKPGNYTVTYIVRDGWGNEGLDERAVHIIPPYTNIGEQNNPPLSTAAAAFPTMPLLGLIGAAAVGSFALVAVRRRKREEPEATLPDPIAPGAPAEVVVPGAPPRRTYVVEGLLVLYKDGRLIHH